MKKLILATTLTALASPAFAGPSCTLDENRKPAWEVVKAFEEQGGEVVKFKISGGKCYEIYGRTDGGKKVELYIDPVTGEILESNES